MFQVPSSNEGLIFHSNLFTDNQGQEVVFEKCIKSGDKKLTAEKGNLLADHRGNAVSKLFQINFHCEASCFVIFRYKCTVTQGTFQSGL